MRNPWLELAAQPPYVLDSDRAIVDAFNRHAPTRSRLQTHLLPEPFIGRPRTATVLLLQLNPGFAGNEARWHRQPAFHDALRANLKHRASRYPHVYLDPQWASTPGGRWSQTRLRRIIEAVGDLERVARHLAVVEFHGYHSRGFGQIPVTLPSQRYAFELVRRAIARNAVIVTIRGHRLWRVAVPELDDHDRVYRPKNPQSAYLTEATVGRRTFATVVDALA